MDYGSDGRNFVGTRMEEGRVDHDSCEGAFTINLILFELNRKVPISIVNCKEREEDQVT